MAPQTRTFDPRLSLLLEIEAAGQLRELAEREDELLGDWSKDLTAARNERLQAGDDEAALKLARAKIRTALGSFIPPLTAGLHYPDDPESKTPATWRKHFKGQDPFVSVLVVAYAPEAELERFGVFGKRIGRVWPALVSLKKVEALAAHPRVLYVELDRPLLASMDLRDALHFIGVDTAPHTRGITGSNSIVGVIDVWLDFGHVDFTTPAGESRVLRFWDQTTPAWGGKSPPAPYIYGTEYSHEVIQAAVQANWRDQLKHYPPDGHGTAVTGCAAGGGRGTDSAGGPYPGAAPEAGIIFVRCRSLDGVGVLATSRSIVDAFTYIFEKAAELRKPCVVNLSHNDNVGPHDGSSPVDNVITSLLVGVPGRAITISSGNYNDKDKHIDYHHVPGGGVGNGFTDLELDSPDVGTFVDIWYEGADRFDVRVTAPTTGAPTINLGPVVAGGYLPMQPVGGNVFVAIRSDLNRPQNGDNQIRITFLAIRKAIVPIRDWKISLKRTVASTVPKPPPLPFHAWINGPGKWKETTPNQFHDLSTVAEPATGHDAIAVANHGINTGAPAYPEINGESGCGPTRNYDVKPDLATLGESLRCPWLGGYSTETGTSLSAALVAGVCALLFDPSQIPPLGPGATCADLKAYLLTNPPIGITLASGTPVPQNSYGAGYMKVL